MWPAGTILNAMNAPARTIFPSGCTAISFTAPFAPAPGSKLGSKEPACGKAGRNREVKERDSSQQRTEVRNSMTGSVEHFQTSRSLRDYRASMNVRVPWRTLDGWRAQLSFGRTRSLEARILERSIRLWGNEVRPGESKCLYRAYLPTSPPERSSSRCPSGSNGSSDALG